MVWFDSYYTIDPISVTLPNGNVVMAQLAGDVIFSDVLILRNALFLPEFNINLVSISKLTKTTQCSCIFTDNTCSIQDSALRKIGLAELHIGLYYLKVLGKDEISMNNVIPSSSNNNVVSSSISIPKTALWHFRFGRVFSEKLSMPCKDFPMIHVNKNKVCDICHFARQRKLPYIVSSSRAAAPFEMLHMDIWGPYSFHSIHKHKYFLTIVDYHSRFTWVCLLKGKFQVQTLV